MANQYIGARYVPKFSGQWVSTNVYEPLTVVDYGNASYISTQNVPAGTLPTNTTYWKLYISPTPSVTELEQKVEVLENDMSTIKPQVNRIGRSFNNASVLWIGDSWCKPISDVTSLHPEIIGNALNFSHLYNESQPGKGYTTTPSYQDILEAFATANGNVVIDYIIVEGSINDMANRTTVGAKIQSFVNKAKQLFPSAVIIGIPPILNCALNLPANTYWWKTFNAIYMGLLNAQVEIVSCPLLFIGLTNLFLTDYIHPNQDGQYYLAKYLIQALTDGDMLFEKRVIQEGIYATPDKYGVIISFETLNLTTPVTLSYLFDIQFSSQCLALVGPSQSASGKIYNSSSNIIIASLSAGTFAGSAYLRLETNPTIQ